MSKNKEVKNSTQKERLGFTFFRSFRDAVEMTNKEEQLLLYKAIADYALDQIEPDKSTLGAMGRLCWTVIEPNLKSGFTSFQNGCQGGAPKGNKNASKTTRKQPKNNLKTTKPLLNENENENENVEKKKEDKKESSLSRSKRSAFCPPSLRELSDYISEMKYSIDPEQFLDYYKANGWKVGKNPMKDWRATVRNWTKRPEYNAAPQPQQPTSTYVPYANDL